MTSSKSRASINKLLALLVVFGVAFVPAMAEAGGRKRVVVLELDGPKAEKFHEGLVKLLKKTHTVVPTEKWASTAEDLGADKLTDGNIKKVAKKLKVDAIVTGKVEKRRDEYIIQLKVRAGSTGAVTGSRIDTSSERPMLDGKASKDLKDELVGAIDTMKSGKGGGDDEEDEEEDRPKKKVAKKDEEEDEEEEDRPKKKSSFGKKSSDEEEDEEEEDKPSKKELAAKKKKEEEERKKAEAEERKEEERRKKEELAAKKEEEKRKKEEAKKKASKKDEEADEEEEEDETKAALKTKKDEPEEEEEEDEAPKKKVAARDGDEEEESVESSSDEVDEGAEKLSVGERAVEAVAGLSFTARKMLFTYQSDLMNHPPPYNGVPVAGLVLDVAVFPLAFGHKNKSMLKNIGITAMYDKVLFINSKSDPDGAGGNAPVTLPTSQSRWQVGAVFRYPLSKTITIGGGLEYGKQTFTIKPAMGVSPGIPNTEYASIMPSVFGRFTFGKLIVGLDATYLSISSAGQIENADQYGAASKNGFEGQISVDYMLKKFLFARVAFRGEAIGFTFTGNGGAMAANRDMDPEKDVFGASDKYYGGIATVGYLY